MGLGASLQQALALPCKAAASANAGVAANVPALWFLMKSNIQVD